MRRERNLLVEKKKIWKEHVMEALMPKSTQNFCFEIGDAVVLWEGLTVQTSMLE